MRKSNILTLLLFGFTALSWGQTFTVTTMAGANPSVSAVALPGIVLYTPEAVHIDKAGMIYIADSGGRRIYKIDPTTNKATAIVGGGQNNNTDSNVTAAGLNATTGLLTGANVNVPTGMVTDAAGNLYFSDRSHARIKKIDTAGKLSSIAGENVPGSGNFGNSSSVPGDGYPSPVSNASTALGSSVNSPRGMCIDSGGNLVWADTTSNRIRRMNLSTSVITTIAGSTGTPTLVAGSAVPGDGGPAVMARLNAPEDVACGADGTIYIADTGNHRIRKIAGGIITTIAGRTNSVTSQSVSALDQNGNPILSTTLTSAAFNGDGLAGTSAQMNSPAGIKLDANGNLIIADRFNSRMRALNLSTGIITTLTTAINTPGRFAIDSTGRLFVPEMGTGTIGAGTNVVKIYDPSTNSTSVFAGINHFSGDSGSFATGALFNQPTGIAVDGTGNIFVSDSGNHRIRKIDTTGSIYTVVGTGVAGNNVSTINGGPNNPNGNTRLSGDGLLGIASRVSNPKALAVDAAGNLYIADTGNHRILMLSATDGTTTTVVGFTGTASANTTLAGTDGITRITSTTYGEGQAANVARLSSPQGVSVDGNGNIYIADTGNHAIRMVSADLSSVTTIAGQAPIVGGAFPAGATSFAGYAGDTGPATGSLLNAPTNVFASADGKTVIIADSANSVVRRISGLGKIIMTIAGVGGQASQDTPNGPNSSNVPANSGYPGYSLRINNPTGVVMDANGKVYFADMSNGRVKGLEPTTLFMSYPLGNSGPSGVGATSSTLIQSTPPIGVNWSADVVNSPAVAVRIGAPWGMAIDASGAIYVVDAGNGQVRKMVLNSN